MSSSFLGLTVEVRLQSGGTVRGRIISIDQATGTLGVHQSTNGLPVSITRGEIADLKMLPDTPAAVPSAPTLQDPAIASYASQARKAAEEIAPKADRSPINAPRGPAAMIPTNSDAGSSGKSRKPAKIKGGIKGGFGNVPDIGTSSKVHTEDETEFEAARNGKKQHGKNKKKALQHAAVSLGESDLDEDFDFDKALQSFDKSRIWQEIKTSDHTDPRSLLVSHNRINGSANDSNRSKYDGRNGQQKLGLHEPVLSPSPTASHASLPEERKVQSHLQEPSDDGSSRANEELQRVRGNALQRELDNTKLRDEIARLETRLRVLEALGGVELKLQSEEVDGHKWKATIYESLTSHAEARRSESHKAAKGALTFLLRTYQGDSTKLRYLGVATDKSDVAVVERLPPQYKNEMGLKTESASVFIRRIKEAVQAK